MESPQGLRPLKVLKKEKCDESHLLGTKCRNFKIHKVLFFFILNIVLFRIPNFAGETLILIRMEETKEEKMTECQEKAYANLLCDFMFKRMF